MIVCTCMLFFYYISILIIKVKFLFYVSTIIFLFIVYDNGFKLLKALFKFCLALGFRCCELNYIINSITKMHVPGIYITYRVYFLWFIFYVLAFKQHFFKVF